MTATTIVQLVSAALGAVVVLALIMRRRSKKA
jgi:hypothetical protein